MSATAPDVPTAHLLDGVKARVSYYELKQTLLVELGDRYCARELAHLEAPESVARKTLECLKELLK